MSVKKISKEQPENFEFTSTSLETANKIIKKYPKAVSYTHLTLPTKA